MRARDAWIRGRALAERANELNPDLAEAEISLAKCVLYSGVGLESGRAAIHSST